MLNTALGYSNCLINSYIFSHFSEILQYDPISCILFAYCTQVYMFPCEPARGNQRSKSGVFSNCLLFLYCQRQSFAEPGTHGFCGPNCPVGCRHATHARLFSFVLTGACKWVLGSKLRCSALPQVLFLPESVSLDSGISSLFRSRNIGNF